MTSGIYQIKNNSNGKLYVGSAANFFARWRDHKHRLRLKRHHSVVLQRAWDKYGSECFAFEPLMICAKKNLLFYEQRFLDALRPHEIGYNISPTANSPFGIKRSMEVKARISAALKGIKLSAETRARMSAARKGIPKSAEWIRKIADSNRGQKRSAECRLRNSFAHKGQIVTEEHRRKLSEAGKRRIFSDATRAKISRAAQGRIMSVKAIEKIRGIT